jgi:folate-binding protein YgfZ
LNAAETIKQRLCDPSQECCAIEVGPEAVQIRRIEAGLPWPGYEITEDYLPAETRQMDRAVSLNKGCYLGQEVVERMRSRGQVARLLVGLVFDGSVNPEPGAELRCPDDKAIGTVTSVCRSPTRNVNLGLGYVRTAFSPPGTSVQAISGQGTFKATVEEIPFVNEPYD